MNQMEYVWICTVLLAPLIPASVIVSTRTERGSEAFFCPKKTHQSEIDILDYPWADINLHTLRWWNIAMESPPLSSMIFPTINMRLVLLIYS